MSAEFSDAARAIGEYRTSRAPRIEANELAMMTVADALEIGDFLDVDGSDGAPAHYAVEYVTWRIRPSRTAPLPDRKLNDPGVVEAAFADVDQGAAALDAALADYACVHGPAVFRNGELTADPRHPMFDDSTGTTYELDVLRPDLVVTETGEEIRAPFTPGDALIAAVNAELPHVYAALQAHSLATRAAQPEAQRRPGLHGENPALDG